MFFFASLKVKRGLQKTYFLFLTSYIGIYTPFGSPVTFAFTLSFMYYIRFLCRKKIWWIWK